MNKSRYVFFILACLFGLYVQAQNRTVKGRVLSAEDKEPLIGATVKIPGTSIGVVTDIDGNFSLEVPDKDKTLVIEFLGMRTLTAKIPANGVLNVSLHPDTQRLDEVVVTGYGNFPKWIRPESYPATSVLPIQPERSSTSPPVRYLPNR